MDVHNKFFNRILLIIHLLRVCLIGANSENGRLGRFGRF